MSMIEMKDVSYRYGRVRALDGLDLAVPDGALYALVGPNGAGKTTLLQLLMGLRRPRSGTAFVMGVPTTALSAHDRERIGYVADGQELPGWMRLDQLDAYLAPLYPTWDAALARDLTVRFRLNTARPIKTFSRGERMKAALRCALAPRPKVLLMDEPFNGMDVMVKDDLVGGLLDSARSEGWTVLISSHDIGELELLADWVGFLDNGRMVASEPMESLLERMRYVDVSGLPDDGGALAPLPAEWMSVNRAGGRLTFLVAATGDDFIARAVALHFSAGARIDARRATLREVFVGLAQRSGPQTPTEVES